MRLTVTSKDKDLIRSGAFAGGIGAGGLEIRPDGKFYRHSLFNDWWWDKELDFYFVHLKDGISHVLRLDDMKRGEKFFNGVKKIIYETKFPEISLTFPDLNVTTRYSSFFIPGDVKNSTLPAVRIGMKGEGTIFFVLRSAFKCESVVKKHGAELVSKEGSIGLISQKAEFYKFGTNLDEISSINMDRGFRIWSKPENYTAICRWSGNVDDELILSWYYPGMKDNRGYYLGHYYNNFFKSRAAVENYVLKNRKMLVEQSSGLYRQIMRAPVSLALKETYSAQLFSLIKQSWLSEKKEFGVWEGSTCCCGLQTTDVAYYGSWLYVNMFPELEKEGIRLTKKFQGKDGWIPHMFHGTFRKIDEYRRKDMNMQFVLMAYRDYYFWKDRDFLEEMYPAIKKAIRNVYSWDKDGDMIPDIEGPDQTFDAWGWKGCTIFLATLWLGALKAGSASARIFNDTKFAAECESTLQTVQQNVIKKLWNGEYFNLWVKGKEKDEACLIDGMSGNWFAELCGLGPVLPENMVKSHLKACLKYNRKKYDPKLMKQYGTPGEAGWCYINGGYRDNHKNCYQQYEPWTGLEYCLALQLVQAGMKSKANRVVKDVYDRKIKCGMSWNHLECGGDYYRAFMIGGVWEAMTGRLKVPRK